MTGKQTEIVLVRHGQTEANVAKILQGVQDIPLSDRGKLQAELVAERLAAQSRPQLIVSSHLSRAIQTAETIAGHFGLPVVTDPAFREMNFGEYEGMTFDEFLKRHPGVMEAVAEGDAEDYAWPGGDTLSGFHQGVQQAFQSIPDKYGPGRIVVVTHGGFLGSLFTWLNGQSPNSWLRYRFLNTSVSEVISRPEGNEILMTNDVSHLEGTDLIG